MSRVMLPGLTIVALFAIAIPASAQGPKEAAARQELTITDPLVRGAVWFEALKPQADDTAMVRRLIGLGIGKAFDVHQNRSPFSIR